jgi:hypothetical protein
LEVVEGQEVVEAVDLAFLFSFDLSATKQKMAQST